MTKTEKGNNKFDQPYSCF